MGPSEEALVMARMMLDRDGVSRGMPQNQRLEVDLAYYLMARAQDWIDATRANGHIEPGPGWSGSR